MRISTEPAPTPNPLERRKEARPSELVAAALELFVEKGYAGTRLEDVAAHAGVSRARCISTSRTRKTCSKRWFATTSSPHSASRPTRVMRFEGSSAELLSHLSSTCGAIRREQGWRTRQLVMSESGNFPEIARFFLESDRAVA